MIWGFNMSRYAARQLNLKRRIERSFANDLRHIYADETKYVAKLAENGEAPTRFKNSVELEQAINRHLKRIRKQMRKSDFVTRALNIYDTIMAERIYNDCVGSFNKLAASMRVKERKASTQLSIGEKNITFSAVCFADEVPNWSDYMFQSIPARALLIANVETQEPYEASKQIESLEQENIEPEVAGNGIAFGTLGAIYLVNRTKTWRSILNQDTRDWHAAADGQTVNILEPFIVNGEQMMYPGDSRTASAKNYMNCHCSVEYN